MSGLETERVPDFGFKVKLNHQFPEKRNQNLRPRLCQVFPLICLALRYVIYFLKTIWKGKRPLMDYWNTLNGKQIYGAPIGGIGSGTIGRGFKGEFCRFQMKAGLYEHETVSANQFIVTIQNQARQTVYQSVLSTFDKPNNSLSSWEWNFDGDNGEYTALYPRAWTVFQIPEHNVILRCCQVSPIIPHNYKDSCVPSAVFIWTLENNSEEVKHVSICLTMKNGTGIKRDDREGGVWSETFTKLEGNVHAQGVKIRQKMREMACTYGIAGNKMEDNSVTLLSYFDPCGSGEDLWKDLLSDGELDLTQTVSHVTKPGYELGCAVCIKSEVPAKSSKRAEFTVAWDIPKIHFTDNKKEYTKYYTKWFGANEDTVGSICHYSLANAPRWQKEIYKWQKPILDDEKLPAWYKSALFNELYFVADGGSIWLLADNQDSLSPSDPRREYGQFAYLEGHEYRMYNTYDVHFYASFALAMLWPKLQAVLQYEICDTISQEDLTERSNLYDGTTSPRKVKWSVPHDIGDPDEEPFVLINAYPIHDVSEWRDLNLKYVLQCYRDYSMTLDQDYLLAMWPKVCAVMKQALIWDTNHDGLIENGGFPDQTYDTWVMDGASAYCGGLWLASLKVTIKMAEHLGERDLANEYQMVLDKGKQAFENILWNGNYYKFDTKSDTIMSDQLCGQWYLKACRVEDPVFPPSNVNKALQTLFDYNVMKFKNGTQGAVNGMLPNGCVDIVTVQSEEVWIGVVYGLAALMIHEGMVDEGFKTAEGIYRTVYEKIGLGFETPEALYTEGHYRSIGYMRPLSIWAMQHAWNVRKQA